MMPEVLEQLLDTSNNAPNKTKVVIEFEIDTQITKRRPAQFRTSREIRRPLNEAHLKNEAFLPKRFTVKLEKGNFSSPSHLDKALDWLPRFDLRLVFDKSPYPAQHEWNGLLTSSPDDIKMWEWKEFCGRPSTKPKRPRTGFLSWLDKLHI